MPAESRSPGRCGDGSIFVAGTAILLHDIGPINFKAHIYVGRGSYIAPNVGIITANHDLYDLDKHQEGRDVVIGDGCWIGMNAIILPGVVLGEHTVVAAGAVVTKSFSRGHVVLGGNPAKVLKEL